MNRGSFHFTLSLTLTFLLLIISGCNDHSVDTGSSPILGGSNPIVLAGQFADSASSSFPLIEYSGDGGATWDFREFSSLGFFESVSCTGGGNQTLCVAAGENGFSDFDGPPLVELSTNGGFSWSPASYFESLLPIDLTTSTCTGAASAATCVVAGQTSSNAAFLAVTKDSGSTWSQTANSVFPVGSSILYATSCTGSGSSATCIATGKDISHTTSYLIASDDSGSTWSEESSYSSTEFDASTCTGGDSGNPLCFVAGVLNGSTGVLAGSNDGGSTWTKYSAGVPRVNSSISCTGTSLSGICAAVGQGGIAQPTIYVSTDAGSTWNVPSISGLTATGRFNQVHCSGSGITAICLAGGQDQTGAEPPMLAESLDGGTTWTLVTIASLPSTGFFTTVKCTGSGSTATCIASGEVGANEAANGPPFIAISTDGAQTWSVPTISALPSNGVLSNIGFGY